MWLPVSVIKTTKQVGVLDDYEFSSAHIWIILRCDMVALGIYHRVQANAHCLENMDTYMDGD